MRRWIFRILLIAFGAAVVYFAVTFVQVWLASRRDQARPVQAIVVLGAAQYDGRPSEVLKARLDHAVELYRRDLAPVIVVTGGRQPGDRFTEATAAADYLHSRGVTEDHIRREVSGKSSWQSLAAAAAFLRAEGIDRVLLVSDPFHSLRLTAMAGELRLHGWASPTRSSPIHGASEVKYIARESFAVGLGRIFGYRKVSGVDRVVTEVRERRTATG
jgi:uncharacterized SAM-binding protein YcdF (DUF218 family)